MKNILDLLIDDFHASEGRPRVLRDRTGASGRTPLQANHSPFARFIKGGKGRGAGLFLIGGVAGN